jgi:hypothetical protein
MRAYYQSKTPEERRRIFVSGRNPERVAAHDKERTTLKAKQEAVERSKARYPERLRARRMVQNEVRYGRLTKQPCFVCGAEKVEAHHPDYDKPLEVIWLCRKDHVQAHA